MLELAMAAARGNQVPPIAAKDRQDLRDFHASSLSGERPIAFSVDAEMPKSFRALPDAQDYRGIGVHA
jgi:hypothetical protein